MNKLVQKSLEPMLIPMDIKEQRVLIDGEDSTTFVGDLNWTTEAIINILKNCVEHTPAGEKFRFLLQKMHCLRKLSLQITAKESQRQSSLYLQKIL